MSSSVLASEINSLQEKITALTDQKRYFQQQHEMCERENAALRRQLEEAAASAAGATSEIERAAIEERRQLLTAIDTLRTQHAVLGEQIQAYRAQAAAADDERRTALDAAAARERDLEALLRDAREELAALHADLRSARERVTAATLTAARAENAAEAAAGERDAAEEGVRRVTSLLEETVVNQQPVRRRPASSREVASRPASRPRPAPRHPAPAPRARSTRPSSASNRCTVCPPRRSPSPGPIRHADAAAVAGALRDEYGRLQRRLDEILRIAKTDPVGFSRSEGLQRELVDITHAVNEKRAQIDSLERYKSSVEASPLVRVGMY